MHAKDDNDNDGDNNGNNNEKAHIENFLSARELIVQSEPFSFKIELQGEAQTQKSKVNEHQAHTRAHSTHTYTQSRIHATVLHTVFTATTRYIERILCAH